MDRNIIKLIIFFSFFFLNEAFAIDFNGKFIQAQFIKGKTDPNTKNLIDKKVVKFSKDGFFVFGIGKDRKFDIVITEGNNKIVKKIQK